jgi:hypothetical protein
MSLITSADARIQGLGNRLRFPTADPPCMGRLYGRGVLGGILHDYDRTA